jgi:hypothetical protein
MAVSRALQFLARSVIKEVSRLDAASDVIVKMAYSNDLNREGDRALLGSAMRPVDLNATHAAF